MGAGVAGQAPSPGKAEALRRAGLAAVTRTYRGCLVGRGARATRDNSG